MTTFYRQHSYPVQRLDTRSASLLDSEVHDPKSALLPRCIRAVKDERDYHHKGRNLIICLDGTGDKFDGPLCPDIVAADSIVPLTIDLADNSNIVHIVGCLKKDDPSQVTYYQSGIGTYNGGGLSNGISAAADMAVGSGLGVHIQDAYRFLMQTYREGDKICLFGFSRGAYTARCLAGMLHKVGLLPAHNIAQLPFAYQFYKDDTAAGWEMSAEFKKTFCIDCNVYFVGVFDCVASVGFIPRKLPFSSTPTSKTGHFRHAMALDEHRAKFKVCHWQKKGTQAQQEHDAKVVAKDKATAKPGLLGRASTGLSFGTASAPHTNGHARGPENQDSRPVEPDAETLLRRGTGKLYKETDVLEVWFMGCHADVGGGAVSNETRHKLSQIPLRWMIRQCFECDTGIIFDTAALAEIGLDVHNLWPLYQRPSIPLLGPSPGMMEAYEKKSLGPIQHRSSHYRRVAEKHSHSESEPNMRFADGEATDGATKDPIGLWTDEHVEDHFDAMAPINDQLVQARGWWILEFWPIKVKFQPRGHDDWQKKVSMNLGRFRPIQETEPKMHWTVKHRIAERTYRIRTRQDRNGVWSVVA